MEQAGVKLFYILCMYHMYYHEHDKDNPLLYQCLHFSL